MRLERYGEPETRHGTLNRDALPLSAQLGAAIDTLKIVVACDQKRQLGWPVRETQPHLDPKRRRAPAGEVRSCHVTGPQGNVRTWRQGIRRVNPQKKRAGLLSGSLGGNTSLHESSLHAYDTDHLKTGTNIELRQREGFQRVGGVIGSLHRELPGLGLQRKATILRTNAHCRTGPVELQKPGLFAVVSQGKLASQRDALRLKRLRGECREREDKEAAVSHDFAPRFHSGNTASFTCLRRSSFSLAISPLRRASCSRTKVLY